MGPSMGLVSSWLPSVWIAFTLVTPQNRSVLLTTRQPAEYSWMSGNQTPLMKIGQSILCTRNSTLNTACPKQFIMITPGPHVSKMATWA